MRNLAWAVAVVAGLGLARSATGDGPPVTDTQGAYEEATATTGPEAGSVGQSTITVEEVRNGAGSMEPVTEETPQERSDRDFVESVWNSP